MPAWKSAWHRVLNLLLYLSFCFMAGTGLLLWIALPPMARRRRRAGEDVETEFLSLSRHEWGDLHLYVGLAFIAMIALHLVLNWTWLTKIAGGKHRWRLWGGLAVGGAILAFFTIGPLVF